MQLDKEDIRSNEQLKFLEKNDSNGLSPFIIFLAVLGAILVSWVIREAYLEWQVQRALSIFNQQMQIYATQSQEQLRAIQLRSEGIRAEAEEKARIKAENQEQQRLAAIQMENENLARIVAAQEEQIRKDKAWALFYKPITGCEADNPNRLIVSCGNDFIKARRRFEATYQSQN